MTSDMNTIVGRWACRSTVSVSVDPTSNRSAGVQVDGAAWTLPELDNIRDDRVVGVDLLRNIARSSLITIMQADRNVQDPCVR